MIAVTEPGNAFIYWVRNLLPPLTDENYGRGKDHWFEYLGKWKKAQCGKEFPGCVVLDAEDPRISPFCRGKIMELDELV